MNNLIINMESSFFHKTKTTDGIRHEVDTSISYPMTLVSIQGYYQTNKDETYELLIKDLENVIEEMKVLKQGGKRR